MALTPVHTVAATEQPVHLPKPAELAEALAVGTHLVVGQYRVSLADGTWWWSDEVYAMHGWAPGDIEPSLDALRSRKHPDDRARIVRTATDALRAGRPFSCAHRIVDGHGRAKTILVTGQGRRGQRGTDGELAGYVIDLSSLHREIVDREVGRAVTRAFVTASVIEQAKGVIMATHGIDDVAAASVLADHAVAVGVPLREAASQLLAALTKHDGLGAAATATVDEALSSLRPIVRARAHDAQLARRRDPTKN